jgi:hypothetical protein
MKVDALEIERENGDRDLLYLCQECEPTIADFARIVSREPANTDCDRCGATEDRTRCGEERER